MLISNLVKNFQGKRILVTGDTYIDREIYGLVNRLAPEAPVPVVKASHQRFIPAGAANVAKNIASLGGNPILHGHFGDDAGSHKILSLLSEDGIEVLSHSFQQASPLTERYRIFASSQQLIQLLKKPTLHPAGDTADLLGEYLVIQGRCMPW